MSCSPFGGRAVAQLAEDVGRALLRFAETKREDAAESTATRRPDERSRRRLQERVLELPGLADPSGLTAGDVAGQLDVAQSNATRALHSLTDRGDLEGVPGERPARWRVPS